ncbi:hypothetical protein DES53_107336 [Roseimicrobium gellanilyticum]|uniref:Uncharacterized protein n=1 Tax=Roseimicrobium gellanilyticum TaxID=748857 RepID=A0A366HG12_9BACT|nr:hypothetical protein [Roseimicrobium gellanilyticum]RBP41503.1 hypothetical protein DES53_107336 [Roseimicrobium gellanilyticum]
MPWIPPSIPILLADASSVTTDEAVLHVDYFPLPFQILCIVLTALFIWFFCIARNPRGWRRLYQSKFCNPEDHSVNRNKRLDELIRKYGIIAAMLVLVADVGFVVWGVTTRHRLSSQRPLTKEEQLRAAEAERIQGGSSKTSARRAVGG